MEHDLPERFIDTVSDWQQRLLQLDRRNNRLYLNPESTSFIRIGNLTADEVTELLQSRVDRGASFDYAEPRANGGPRVTEGDLKVDSEPIELQKRLGNIRRRAREWQEQKGVPVLYLALGLLRWIDERGETATAPLLLLPCELKKTGPRTAFRLVLPEADVEFEPNETLNRKLYRDISVKLPEANSGAAPSEYFSQVSKLIRNTGKNKPWGVEPQSVLGIFSYSKLPMWRDLEHLKTHGTDNRIVSALSGLSGSDMTNHFKSPIPDTPEDLRGARLDCLLQLKDQHTILDADYSQLIAITHARNGDNLVIHGPPGTGKSQTITNMIATFMAEGKSVLFVSEKTAALDVVRKRLNSEGLDTFCLDLHSDRIRKANVYTQLRASINPAAVSHIQSSPRNIQALKSRRKRLNKYVRLIHQTRPAIEKSVYEINGRYSTLHEVPALKFAIPFPLQRISTGWLDEVRSLLETIAQHPEEYKQHATSPWRVLKSTTPNISLATSIRADMAKVKGEVDGVSERLSKIAVFLGVECPKSAEDASRLSELLEFLRVAPTIPVGWLSSNLPSLEQACETEHEIQRSRTECVSFLERTYGSVPGWDFQRILNNIDLSQGERENLKESLGSSWSTALTEKWAFLLNKLNEAAALAREAQDAFIELNNFLDLPVDCNRASIAECLKTSAALSSLKPIPPAWISDTYESILAALRQAKNDQEAINAAEQTIFADYDKQIMDSVNREMLVRYRTKYQSFMQSLLSICQYRKDKRVLQGHRRQPASLTTADEAAVVQQVVSLAEMQAEWEQHSDQREEMFGRRFQGRETDWDAIEQDFAEAVRLARLSEKICSLLVAGSHSEQSSAERVLGEKASSLDKALRSNGKSVIDDDLYATYEHGRISINELENSLSAIRPLLERIIPEISLLVGGAICKPLDFNDATELAKIGAKLQTIESDANHRKLSLQAQFGYKYTGFSSDWNQIKSDINWTKKFLRTASSPVSISLANHAANPLHPDVYRNNAAAVSTATGEFHNAESILSDYDLHFAPWTSWSTAHFTDIAEWAFKLHENADKASDYVQYRNAAAELENLIGNGAIDACRKLTEDARIVPDTVMRGVISNWLGEVYKQERSLRDFSSDSHENLRTSFRDADKQFLSDNSAQIKERMRRRYDALKQSSEFSVLRREAAKRSGQMPVRKLLETIPSCIQGLKPCFFMSPLAVSQYLATEAAAKQEGVPIPAPLKFDVVIFDEASQVFPWDAIPALLRGKQAILAGDQKQLPPSNFWGHSYDDDYDSDDSGDDSNDLKGYQSILDVAVGSVNELFRESHLNTHYRSRHEDLIRFSNHHFYENRLLTFPSPGTRDDWQGVHGHFLQHALYDRGKTRINYAEGNYVVDLLFDLLRSHSGQSIGVAALSRQQADYIEGLIQDRAFKENLDAFREETSEPLFVKNLENLQGDERDHIIISIGYGPSKPGERTPNFFGPILNKDGERRLNVLMTRARERMDVVYSVDPTHITSLGAQRLRQFLEYVADPLHNAPSSSRPQQDTEAHDDFKQSVRRELQAHGRQVYERVGSADYRIDLAIRSEDGARYDLGIECDGATYYSVPAARDRDWLRQSVLESLGWKIHRVWSTAWAQNPAAEIERIEEALRRSRARP